MAVPREANVDREQTIELLQATHEFPCAYTLKVIGLSANDFVARVVLAVREALCCDDDPPYRMRRTPGGKHVAVTIEPNVDSAHQVLLIYDRIRTVDGVVMTM